MMYRSTDCRSRAGAPIENLAIAHPSILEVTMAAPIRLRSDFDAARRRALAKHSRDPDQTRQFLALAVLYEGGSRTDAARMGAVGLQTVRDWVLCFIAEGPEGLLTDKAPGACPLLNPEQRQA
jgi:hypothetical protein